MKNPIKSFDIYIFFNAGQYEIVKPKRRGGKRLAHPADYHSKHT